MRKKAISGLLFIHFLTFSAPIFAQQAFTKSADLSAVSPIPQANQLIHTTTTALLTTISFALLATITLAALRRLRWISPKQELRATRALRVIFGALVLLATTLPYLTLNFPPSISTPIIISILLALSALLWTQSQHPNTHEPILD